MIWSLFWISVMIFGSWMFISKKGSSMYRETWNSGTIFQGGLGLAR